MRPESQTELTESSFDSATLLTIVVGEEPGQKRFSVHESFICSRSEFFRRAMNGDWAEREERLVKLPEDDPETFGIYVNLIYTDSVATTVSDVSDAASACASEFVALSKLYVLSEKLCDNAAKNATVDALWNLKNDTAPGSTRYAPTHEAINILYAGTPKTSLARQLMADMWTDLKVSYVATVTDQLPRDFLVDLSISLLKDRPSSKPSVECKPGVSRYLKKLD